MVDDIERQSFFVVIFCFSSLFLLFFFVLSTLVQLLQSI